MKGCQERGRGQTTPGTRYQDQYSCDRSCKVQVVVCCNAMFELCHVISCLLHCASLQGILAQQKAPLLQRSFPNFGDELLENRTACLGMRPMTTSKASKPDRSKSSCENLVAASLFPSNFKTNNTSTLSKGQGQTQVAREADFIKSGVQRGRGSRNPVFGMCLPPLVLLPCFSRTTRQIGADRRRLSLANLCVLDSRKLSELYVCLLLFDLRTFDDACPVGILIGAGRHLSFEMKHIVK